MIYPWLWPKFLRARLAMRDYPYYDAPNKQAEAELSEAKVQENFAYFMRVRLDRLAHFQRWLHRRFGVRASLDGDGVRAVSAWVDAYGGGLIGEGAPGEHPFSCYQPPWRGKFVGYNVMLDIGIFLGEYLIAKQPKLHWAIYRGHVIEPASFRSPSYLRPVLVGLPYGWISDVLQTGYGVVKGNRYRANIGHNPVMNRSGALVEEAKSSLYSARMPEGDGPVIIGDSTNEPL